MKPAGVVVGIIVLILWFLGATLIAAPSSVANMIIPPSLHLTSSEIDLFAISAFIVAAIIIALYVSTSEDETRIAAQPLSKPS
ncbi:MAG: hypothetical protein PXY39_12775 [archaeon]|nr:hypothetical protein [archaeon]